MRIRELSYQGDYFDLVHVSITDEPISVRIGRPVWQSLEDEQPGHRRFQIPFVAEQEDDLTDGGRDPRSIRTSRVAVAERARLRSPLTELVAAQVLDEAALARTKAAAEAAWPNERLELQRVDDVTPHRR